VKRKANPTLEHVTVWFQIKVAVQAVHTIHLDVRDILVNLRCIQHPTQELVTDFNSS
jgi:hypothetical protein